MAMTALVTSSFRNMGYLSLYRSPKTNMARVATGLRLCRRCPARDRLPAAASAPFRSPIFRSEWQKSQADKGSKRAKLRKKRALTGPTAPPEREPTGREGVERFDSQPAPQYRTDDSGIGEVAFLMHFVEKRCFPGTNAHPCQRMPRGGRRMGATRPTDRRRRLCNAILEAPSGPRASVANGRGTHAARRTAAPASGLTGSRATFQHVQDRKRRFCI